MNEPLHLTDANKADIRALVDSITDSFAREARFHNGARLTGFDWIKDDYSPAKVFQQQFNAAMRRGFIPQLVTQIYNSSPLISEMLKAAQEKPRAGAHFSWDVQHDPGPKMKAQRRFDQLDARRRKSMMRGRKV